MAEQTTFLASAADANATAAVTEPPAEQSAAGETTPPPEAATGQTVATQAETAPPTSGQAEATNPAPVEVKVPEGVELDGGLLEAIKAGDPQKVVDAYAKVIQQERDAWDAQGKAWKDEIAADKEFGGAHQQQTVAWMQKAVAKFADKELVKELETLGLGNHPRLVRFIARVGKAMSEDTVAGTTAPTNGSGSPDYRAWFPGENLNP